jgi:hypothetical protein
MQGHSTRHVAGKETIFCNIKRAKSHVQIRGHDPRTLQSSKNTPWCASDPSPGIGTWPPPSRPTSEIV